MANRVLLGKRGSDYGLFVSKSGSNVVSCDDDDMLFDSRKPRHGQILKAGLNSCVNGTNSTVTATIPASENVMVFLGGNTNFNKPIAEVTAAQTLSSNTLTITFSTSSSTVIGVPFLITTFEVA